MRESKIKTSLLPDLLGHSSLQSAPSDPHSGLQLDSEHYVAASTLLILDPPLAEPYPPLLIPPVGGVNGLHWDLQLGGGRICWDHVGWGHVTLGPPGRGS